MPPKGPPPKGPPPAGGKKAPPPPAGFPSSMPKKQVGAPGVGAGPRPATGGGPGSPAAARPPQRAASPTAKQNLDPFLNLPYAVVPNTLLPTFEGCNKLAIFLVIATNQIIAGNRKPFAVMLSAESLYIMKPSGEIVRRLDFKNIKVVITNLAAASTIPEDQRAKFQPFALFMMHETRETSDAVFVDAGVGHILQHLKKILHATQATSIRFESVSCRKVSEVGVVFREPQTHRDGIGENDRSLLQTREHVAQQHYEQVQLKDQATAAGAAGTFNNAPKSDSAAFIRNQAALRGDGHAVSKRDPLTNLPYARIPVEYEQAYPLIKSNEYALLWFGPIFHYNLVPEQHHATNLQFRQAFLTCERLYVGDGEDKFLRCLRLDSITTIFVPESISILKPKVTLPDDPVNNCNCGVVMMFRNEHDLFLGFMNTAQQQTFVTALNTIVKGYFPAVAIRVQRCENISDCRAMLATPQGYTAAVVDVPKRSSAAPALGANVTALAMAAAKDAANIGGVAPATSGPLPCANVPKAVCIVHPPLVRIGCLWADKAALHKNPQQQGSGVSMTAAFLTETHLHLAAKNETLRCIHIQSMDKLLLKALDRPLPPNSPPGAITSKRNFILIVCTPPEHDLLFEVADEESAKDFFAQYLRTCKKNCPGHDPTFGSFDKPEEAIYRYEPYPTYQLHVQSPLPPDPTAPDYCSRLERFYEKYDPSKISTVENILANFKGSEEAMFSKLVEKYGAEPPAPPPSAPKQPPTPVPTPAAATAASPTNAAARTLSDPVGGGDDLGPDTTTSGKWKGYSYKTRLTAFCTANCPEKLEHVDAVLSAYKGNEEAMFTSLSKKYGEEPDPPKPAASTSAAGESAVYRDRLIRVYQKYEPSKLGSVDTVLNGYRGREEELMAKLVEAYGPEPGFGENVAPTATAAVPTMAPVPGLNETPGPMLPPVGNQPPATTNPTSTNTNTYLSPTAQTSATVVRSAQQQRLIRFYNVYDQNKLANVNTILEGYVGREEELFRKLVEKYGPEPAADGSPQPQQRQAEIALDPNAGKGTYKERLTRYTAKYLPEKLHLVDDVLAQNKGREEAMMQELVRKYGPEPIPMSANAAASAATNANGSPHRARLIRFYEKYQPDKIPTVDRTLQGYSGSEEELFRLLVQKYGPEPTISSVAVAPTASPPPNVGAMEISPPAANSPNVPRSVSESAGVPPQQPPPKIEPRMRARLARFYSHYEPSKNNAVNIDSTLQRYHGFEEDLFQRLVEKYGPEPIDTSKFSKTEDVYQAMDMTTELGYADIPVSEIGLFPSLTNAALYWFGPVNHWEPPAPPGRRFAFLTKSYLYVADNETVYYRCVNILSIMCIFINSKRLDKDEQCSMILKLHPAEHDLFLTFESDFAAKKLLWCLLEIVNRYHFRHNIPACAVASLNEGGIDPHCERGDGFRLHLEPVPTRPKLTADDLERLESQAQKKYLGELDESSNVPRPKMIKPGFGNQSAGTTFGSVPFANGGSGALPSHDQPPLVAGSEGNPPRFQPRQQSPQFGEVGLDFGTKTSKEEGLEGMMMRGVNPLQQQQFSKHANDGTFGRSPGFKKPIGVGPGSLSNFFIENEMDDPDAPQSLPNNKRSKNIDDDSPFVKDAKVLGFFLEQLDLDHYAPLLIKKRITLETLEAYNEEDFAHFGIVYEDDRKKLMEGLNNAALMDQAKAFVPRDHVAGGAHRRVTMQDNHSKSDRSPESILVKRGKVQSPSRVSTQTSNFTTDFLRHGGDVLGSAAFFPESEQHYGTEDPAALGSVEFNRLKGHGTTPRSVLENLERSHGGGGWQENPMDTMGPESMGSFHDRVSMRTPTMTRQLAEESREQEGLAAANGRQPPQNGRGSIAAIPPHPNPATTWSDKQLNAKSIYSSFVEATDPTSLIPEPNVAASHLYESPFTAARVSAIHPPTAADDETAATSPGADASSFWGDLAGKKAGSPARKNAGASSLRKGKLSPSPRRHGQQQQQDVVSPPPRPVQEDGNERAKSPTMGEYGAVSLQAPSLALSNALRKQFAAPPEALHHNTQNEATDASPSPRKLRFHEEAEVVPPQKVPSPAREDSTTVREVNSQLSMLREIGEEKRVTDLTAKFAPPPPTSTAVTSPPAQGYTSTVGVRAARKPLTDAERVVAEYALSQAEQDHQLKHRQRQQDELLTEARRTVPRVPGTPPHQPNASSMNLPERDVLNGSTNKIAPAPKMLNQSGLYGGDIGKRGNPQQLQPFREDMLRQLEVEHDRRTAYDRGVRGVGSAINNRGEKSAERPPGTFPVDIRELSTNDVSTVLEKLNISEHKGNFSRTDGHLLSRMSKEDIRLRFKGDNEAADILLEWLRRREERLHSQEVQMERIL